MPWAEFFETALPILEWSIRRDLNRAATSKDTVFDIAQVTYAYSLKKFLYFLFLRLSDL